MSGARDASGAGASRSTPRDRILASVRAALAERARIEHPGHFLSWRSGEPPAPVDGLREMLEAAGGEVVRCATNADARAWLADFARDFASAAVGETVPDDLRPALPTAPPAGAPLGVSLARGAIAETGSLLLDARDGRRAQLLPPTHVVFVRARDVHATFRDAVLAVQGDLPSAIGLHSGPSKSADIAHVMVKGVHGPGRLVAVVIEGV